MNELFRRFSAYISSIVGSAPAFVVAVTVIAVWAITGPMFNFSDTWQLIINTSTTIVTFLMVFLIQNTQNRDAKSIHLQLDELIKSSKNASNAMVDLEDASDDELAKLQKKYSRIHDAISKHVETRKKKTN